MWSSASLIFEYPERLLTKAFDELKEIDRKKNNIFLGGIGMYFTHDARRYTYTNRIRYVVNLNNNICFLLYMSISNILQPTK